MEQESGMNAFVAGLVPSDTVMVVTRGLLNTLSRHELQGVVAHEFSHIFNADMRLNLRLIAILGGILALGQLGYFLLRTMRFSGSRRSSSKSNNQMGMIIIGSAVSLLVVGYIGLFFGRLIKASISRQREFLADASAVQYSRDSMGIANALYRIKTNSKGSLLDSSHAEDMSHMCFGSALNFSAFSNLLATHPPIDDRIKTLVPSYKAPPQQHEQEQEQTSTASDESMNVSSFSQSVSSEKVSAADVVSSIGTMNPEQLQHAKKIHQTIPDELLDAIHHSDNAMLVIYALILVSAEQMDTDVTKYSVILSALENNISNTFHATIIEYCERVSSLDKILHLPLVELSIPALKQLNNKQIKDFLASVSLLIAADKKVLPFEFFLYSMLRKNLTKQDASFHTKSIKKYKTVLSEIEYLTAVLSQASGGTVDITSVMKSFSPQWKTSNAEAQYEAKRLNSALLKLNQLTPLLKKPLMRSLADIIEQDGEINHTELELLRSVGIYLECPIPPLIY